MSGLRKYLDENLVEEQASATVGDNGGTVPCSRCPQLAACSLTLKLE